ncbi:MAG: sugar ABC transporter ATP-binding protein [Planctomycetes bacterium]|nr:sugar ABC transporter ATP-binding protein [Planctomycetota bacterium]MCC8115792.1 sugar ABC transporter ATP-binding protein [Planctomycetota bacterium]MCD7897732.1 sugar ABC transporter ATP-binding protein [Planctomycetaceae bacterium]
MNESDVFLKVDAVSKSFSGNLVLRPFSLDVRPGEFHALIGENGAGKSTMINLVTGVYEPDGGSLIVEGRSYSRMTPSLAKSLGIHAVHQELSLNRHLTVTENIFLGDEPLRHGLFRDKRRMRQEARELLRTVGLDDVDPDADVGSLPLSDQQLLEFSKAVYKKPRLLILDEATSALNTEQVETLFNRLKELKSTGLSVIFISHRLHELYQLCDIMTVLKDGELITTEPMGDFDQDRLVSLMTGRSIVDLFPPKRTVSAAGSGDEAMRLENVSTRNLSDINLTVRKGEILGIGGLAGQGQQPLMECLFGVEPVRSGRVLMDGREVRLNGPQGAMDLGIAYIPAERKTQGLFVSHSNRFNMSFARLKSISSRLGTISSRIERRDNMEQVDRLSIKLRNLGQAVGELSGGNQQKVVLAKWLLRKPRVLLLNEPTRGIDIGTKKQIYELLADLARDGVAIVMISSDTLELIGLCDRVAVMYENAINTELSSGDLSEESLVHASVFQKEATTK